jgi:2-polyprenyl-6-methoxyphenol hydroxylase-like FAD-dependent oxidoreductase
VDQQALEAMLADRALSLGVDVRRECDVAGFVQRADGVDVEWTSPTGADHIRCTYLVGCDGGRSFIRKRADFEFPGTDPSSTSYQAVAQIDHPERLAPMGWRHTSGGVFSYGPFPSDWSCSSSPVRLKTGRLREHVRRSKSFYAASAVRTSV